MLIREVTVTYLGSSSSSIKNKTFVLEVIILRLLSGIGNNVMVRPGYVIATTSKPGYIRSTQEASL